MKINSVLFGETCIRHPEVPGQHQGVTGAQDAEQD